MDRGRRRKLNFSKAKRKKKIAQVLYGGDIYEHDNQYSKNKVHCSCPMCSAKSNGENGENWSHSDLKKIASMNNQLKEYSGIVPA